MTDHNDMLIARIKGLPAQPATPETDADPTNPNRRARTDIVFSHHSPSEFCIWRVTQEAGSDMAKAVVIGGRPVRPANP